MALQEAFEIQLNGGAIRGTLHSPADVDSAMPMGAVLICRGVQSAREDASTLIDEMIEALCNAGLASAVFEHRCAQLILEDFDAHGAGHDIEDASAVLDWLMARPGIDPAHLGVVGFSLGAIAATALAGRYATLARLCLLSAATTSSIGKSPSKNNGASGPTWAERLPAAYLPSLSAIDALREVALHDRPNLIVHGAADRVVPPAASLEYLAALEAAGRQVEHVLIARGSHALALPEPRSACLEQVVRFFAAMLVEPEKNAVAKSSA